MDLVKDTISILTALMMASTGLTAPSIAPAVNDTLENISLQETAAIVEDYDMTQEMLTTIKAANALAGKEAITAYAAQAAEVTSTELKSATGLFEDDESQWYCSKIPMKKEHQKLLWDCCKERGLDYIDMLALISLESNFQEKCSSGKYKGYFQLSSDHGPRLSKILGTENKPLDGEINIKWGTAFYSWILEDKRVKGKEGKAQRDTALSIYQRGTGGYDRKGLNYNYLAKYYKKRDIIVSYFGSE